MAADGFLAFIKTKGYASRESVFGAPLAHEDDPQRAAWASPLYHVNEDSAPHLLAHGDQDTLVPIAHSYRLLSRLQQFGVESSLYVRRGHGHDGNAFYGHQRLRRQVAEFFAYHLEST